MQGESIILTKGAGTGRSRVISLLHSQLTERSGSWSGNRGYKDRVLSYNGYRGDLRSRCLSQARWT
jgi:hypothetical protein